MKLIDKAVGDMVVLPVGDERYIYKVSPALTTVRLLARGAMAEKARAGEPDGTVTDQDVSFGNELLRAVLAHPKNATPDDFAAYVWTNKVRPHARLVSGVINEGIDYDDYAYEIACLHPGDVWEGNLGYTTEVVDGEPTRVGGIELSVRMPTSLDAEKLTMLRPDTHDSFEKTVAAWCKFIDGLFSYIQGDYADNWRDMPGPAFGALVDFMMIFVGLRSSFRNSGGLQPLSDEDRALLDGTGAVNATPDGDEPASDADPELDLKPTIKGD